MKILVLGADGQVGRTLLAELPRLGDVEAATRTGSRKDGGPAHRADLADPVGLVALLDRVRPDVLINAAAYTAVDRAESDQDTAFLINATAVAVLAQWAALRRALLVHYSTDYVFNGEAHSPYTEDDPVAPLGAYGRSKRAGEEMLIASTAPHLLFRTAWVYSPHGKNFLLTMLRLAGERNSVSVVDDQVGAPTTAALIARHTAAAVSAWWNASIENRHAFEGIYHVVAGGQTSWHGFAEAIFDAAIAAGLVLAKPQLTAIATSAFPTPARRPGYSVLATTKFQRTFAIAAPDWTLELAETIAALAKGRSH